MTGARAARPGSGSKVTAAVPFHEIWRLRAARLRRRSRRLAGFARAILLGAPEARPLAPAAWLFLAGWLAPLAAPPAAAAPAFVAASGALFVLLALAALIDGLYFLLPDGPLLALAGLALLIRADDPPAALAGFAGAGLAAYAAFLLFARLHEKISGRPGLGGGDARLFGVAGLWLGFEGLPSCLLIAALSGLLAAALSWRGGMIAGRDDPLPFGPHLALGLWLTWMFGPLAL
jgi:leader peptidase (prepilin peptidase)/N-methyltransferase